MLYTSINIDFYQVFRLGPSPKFLAERRLPQDKNGRSH